MKIDAIYDEDKDRIVISYQETPSSPVTTIGVARGHEHHVRHVLDDLELAMGDVDGWEYHFKDADKDYGP